MTATHLGVIVEGPGDVASAPTLFALLADHRGFDLPQLSRPIACNGINEAVKEGGLEGFVATAANRPGCAGIVVMLDGEGKAVCQLGPSLLARAQQITNLPITLALADFMYESWLVASAETMRLEGLTFNAARGDPVGAIKRALGNRKYAKPTWQPRLTERLDIGLASGRSHSLNRFGARLEAISALL